MARLVKVLPRAEAELIAPRLGNGVDLRVSTKNVEVRKMFILDPPLDFVVYYRVMPESVDILHVRHCARRPPRKGSIGK